MNWKTIAAIVIGLTLSAAVAGAGFAAAKNEREVVMKHIKRALRPIAEMKKAGSFDPAETAKRGQEIGHAVSARLLSRRSRRSRRS